MGFGHRVYKHYDPRAKIIKESFYSALASLGIKDDPLLNIAMRLEEAALRDDYFLARKLYPNVDFYSGLIMRAIGFRRTCSRSCSPSAGCPGGSPIGRKWPPIRKAASTARARFTSARTSATTCRPTGGSEGETGQIGKAGNWKIGNLRPPSASLYGSSSRSCERQRVDLRLGSRERQPLGIRNHQPAGSRRRCCNSSWDPWTEQTIFALAGLSPGPAGIPRRPGRPAACG